MRARLWSTPPFSLPRAIAQYDNRRLNCLRLLSFHSSGLPLDVLNFSYSDEQCRLGIPAMAATGLRGHRPLDVGRFCVRDLPYLLL